MVKTVFKTTSGRSKSNAAPQFLVAFAEGDTIFQEGELGTEMFIIQDGKVEILKQAGLTERHVALLAQGDFFGEMSVLEDLPRTATARALTEVKALKINGTTFDQMLRRNPEIAVRMMRKLSRRLRETDRLLRETIGSEESQAPEVPPADPTPSGPTGPEWLHHEASGLDLFLASGEETTIGRRDPVTGINPDIDLTPIDTQRSISRRHAKILRHGGKFFVREEIGTMNGTFVNNVRIETGVPAEFQDGDEVRFGLVKTVFHLR